MRRNGSEVSQRVNTAVSCGNHNSGGTCLIFHSKSQRPFFFNRARITLAVEHLGNRQLGRAKRLEGNIKKIVKQTRCKSGLWTQVLLSQGANRRTVKIPTPLFLCGYCKCQSATASVGEPEVRKDSPGFRQALSTNEPHCALRRYRSGHCKHFLIRSGECCEVLYYNRRRSP